MNTQQYRLTSEEFIAAIEQCAEQGDTFIRINIVEAMPQSKNELEKIKRALDKMSNNYKDEINYQCVEKCRIYSRLMDISIKMKKFTYNTDDLISGYPFEKPWEKALMRNIITDIVGEVNVEYYIIKKQYDEVLSIYNEQRDNIITLEFIKKTIWAYREKVREKLKMFSDN